MRGSNRTERLQVAATAAASRARANESVPRGSACDIRGLLPSPFASSPVADAVADLAEQRLQVGLERWALDAGSREALGGNGGVERDVASDELADGAQCLREQPHALTVEQRTADR